MDASYEHVEHHGRESPLPELANHWVLLLLPPVAVVTGLLFVGTMLLTLH